jgi:hypothetical protein
MLEKIPAGRFGVLEDLIGATVFLCSDASRYVRLHSGRMPHALRARLRSGPIIVPRSQRLTGNGVFG